MLVAKMVTMVNDLPDEQHEQYHCDDVDKKDDVKLMSKQGSVIFKHFNFE